MLPSLCSRRQGHLVIRIRSDGTCTMPTWQLSVRFGPDDTEGVVESPEGGEGALGAAGNPHQRGILGQHFSGELNVSCQACLKGGKSEQKAD